MSLYASPDSLSFSYPNLFCIFHDVVFHTNSIKGLWRKVLPTSSRIAFTHVQIQRDFLLMTNSLHSHSCLFICAKCHASSLISDLEVLLTYRLPVTCVWSFYNYRYTWNTIIENRVTGDLMACLGWISRNHTEKFRKGNAISPLITEVFCHNKIDCRYRKVWVVSGSRRNQACHILSWLSQSSSKVLCFLPWLNH